MGHAAPSVAEIPAAARARLERVFDREGVVQAAVIGSYARGEQQPASDLDIAVWLEPKLTASDALELLSALLADAQRAVGPQPRVDLVDLRRAPPVVRRRSIEDADVLTERDHDARVRLDRATLVEFWDTAPLREMQRDALRRRLREGRFGRP